MITSVSVEDFSDFIKEPINFLVEIVCFFVSFFVFRFDITIRSACGLLRDRSLGALIG